MGLIVREQQKLLHRKTAVGKTPAKWINVKWMGEKKQKKLQNQGHLKTGQSHLRFVVIF